MAAIRILVVDDHTLFRRGIVGLLEDSLDMEVVGQAGTGQEALREAVRTCPDLVLMDVGLPDLDGLRVTRELKKRLPRLEVLILTVHDREDYIFQAVQAGASGYILKEADVEDLLSAIRSVARGEVYLYPTVARKLLKDYLRRAQAGAGEDGDNHDVLTEREREVLRLIALGHTTPEIARLLYLSPHTVQTHRDHIMRKLNLHRRAGLIRYAISKGLVDAEP